MPASVDDAILVGDRKAVAAMVNILSAPTRRRGLAALVPFLGPAFVASVAYVDPGNFATNLQGGARYGYLLLWVIFASNLTAMLVQMLSAKLGLATGMNLAEICRAQYPRWLVWCMWAVMEIVAMATDLAEFLGAAIGLYLLFGMSLGAAGVLTAVITFVLLGVTRYGFRPFEIVITTLVAVIAGAYLVEVLVARPDVYQIAKGALLPRFAGAGSMYLACGILGATVMPHVIFLHSALMQGRLATRDPVKLRYLFRVEVIDVVVAMSIAGMVNAAMLITAATTFHDRGLVHVDALEQAHLTLRPLLGVAASQLFAIALLASGLASSAVGTLAGQVIMQGFIKRHIPVWVRRLVTMAPALFVIFAGLNPTDMLVLSQVVLSFGLPFAVVPLVLFTRRTDLMGPLANSRLTTAAAAAVALLIVGLNLLLLIQTLKGS